MTGMDNIDTEYLASHPADGTPARITLTEDAPRGTYTEGSPSAITVEAEAGNYLDLLVALEALNEQQPRLQFTSRWVQALVDPGRLPELRTAGTTEDLLTDVVTACHSPFLSFTAPVVFSLGEEEDRMISISLTVTAPSVFAGMQALKHLTTPRVLESTARELHAPAENTAN